MSTHASSAQRWIAVVPGAIAYAIGAAFLLHWMLYFTLARGETISGVDIRPIESALYPSVLAAAFVLGGAAIAPSRKVLTASVLLVLWIATAIILLVTPTGAAFGRRAFSAIVVGTLAVLVVRHRSGRQAETVTVSSA